ncbi:hypothetical protein J4405_06100 [Candidatus Woesearchaeota archaeon]|nr:hypothetical protein [Candidatus Woesearchaeota archaeon]
MQGINYLQSAFAALAQTDKPIVQTDVLINLDKFLAEVKILRRTADNKIRSQLDTLIIQIGLIKSAIRGKNYEKAKKDLDIVMKEVENI